MSDDRIVVNFPALQQASTDIQSALTMLRQQLDDCDSAAVPLVASWEGNAQQAYEARQRKWRTASDNLANMLREIKVAVEQSADEFRATETRNANMFQ